MAESDDAFGARIARVLIHRRGALGDTLVALPCLHLLRRTYPDAELRLLTVAPEGSAEVGAQALLGGTGLIDSYQSYPARTRDWRILFALVRQLRVWGPEHAIYLAEPQGAARVWRDWGFLHACGARRVIGAPLAGAQRRHLPAADGLAESEAGRLARCLSDLGDARPALPASWDLHLTRVERQAASAALGGWPARERFIAFAPGSKARDKDWGEVRWGEVLAAVSQHLPDLGLLLLGAAADAARAARLAGSWRGPVLNLCGRTTVRDSAALLAEARVFIGHDSGPMHLAAAVGTPTVCVFHNAAPAGVWFPVGLGHRPLYPSEAEGSIAGISPARVIPTVLHAYYEAIA